MTTRSRMTTGEGLAIAGGDRDRVFQLYLNPRNALVFFAIGFFLCSVDVIYPYNSQKIITLNSCF